MRVVGHLKGVIITADLPVFARRKGVRSEVKLPGGKRGANGAGSARGGRDRQERRAAELLERRGSAQPTLG